MPRSYNLNAHCKYHQGGVHTTDKCFHLRYDIQDRPPRKLRWTMPNSRWTLSRKSISSARRRLRWFCKTAARWRQPNQPCFRRLRLTKNRASNSTAQWARCSITKTSASTTLLEARFRTCPPCPTLCPARKRQRRSRLSSNSLNWHGSAARVSHPRHFYLSHGSSTQFRS